MIILNVTKNSVVADKAAVANTFLTRMTGLLKHKDLARNEALIITRCNSIHMFFMKFPIDVIFINKLNKVVGLVKNIKPNQLSPVFWRAESAIELSTGTIASTKTELGDTIQFQ